MKSVRRTTWSNKEARFIQLWKDRQYLYDFSSKGYHDRSRRDRAWEEIAEQLQIPVKEIMVRASSLRTQYGKLMHLKPSSRGHRELTSRQKWILKNMEFLKKHVTPRGTFSTLQDEADAAEDDPVWEVKVEDDTSPTSPAPEPRDSSTPSPSPRASPPRRRAKRLRARPEPGSSSREDADSLEREKVALLKQAVSLAFAPEDSADIFGKFVATKLREISSPVERTRAEHSITSTLYAALSHCSQLETNVIKIPESAFSVSPAAQALHPSEGQQPYQLLVQIQPSMK